MAFLKGWNLLGHNLMVLELRRKYTIELLKRFIERNNAPKCHYNNIYTHVVYLGYVRVATLRTLWFI